MNEAVKICAEWQRTSKTGVIQPNFFKGGISSVKETETRGKLNPTGGYFALDGSYSLDAVAEEIQKWLDERRVGNLCIYCSCGDFVALLGERTIKPT